LLLIALLTFTLPLSAEETEEFEVFSLINERLGHMQNVAAWKWINQRPIEDLSREAVVIREATLAARRMGLEQESTSLFFNAQIDAAKEIQQYWFQEWSKNVNPPDAAPDLAGAIRPELSRLGDRITTALAMVDIVDTAGSEQRFLNTLEQPGLSLASKRTLYKAIISIRHKHYDNTLVRVLTTGVIRIGTTADYAPFSYRQENDQLTGIDIEMGKALAGSLSVEIVWVQTSWPTLMSDLKAGRFDIAMSGISRNVARQRHAFFTQPYHTGGKTPITRCGEEQQFDSLDKIDQTDVRVIVNPGGTNFRFTESLKQAQVRIYDDNNTIFDEIAQGRADVMITDAVEVILQSHQTKTLCPSMPGKTLTYLEKAYMMPQDIVWKEYVNTWLDQALMRGELDLLKSKYLN